MPMPSAIDYDDESEESDWTIIRWTNARNDGQIVVHIPFDYPSRPMTCTHHDTNDGTCSSLDTHSVNDVVDQLCRHMMSNIQ